MKPIVLLHGWANDHTIMKPLAERLSPIAHIYTPDLLGYGLSMPTTLSLKASNVYTVAEQVAKEITEPAHYIGWSLGGLVSLALAERWPTQVLSISLISSSACFIKQTSWPGIQPSTLRNYATQLNSDPNATLNEFMTLELYGSQHCSKHLNALKTHYTQPVASPETLQAGLQLLCSSDFRALWGMLKCPALHAYGRFDHIIPLATQTAMSQLNPNAKTHIFDHSGHLPFLTETKACAEQLTHFYHALS